MINEAKIIEVILVCAVVGNGTPENPTRQIQEIWSKEGDLICVMDPAFPTESRSRGRGRLRTTNFKEETT
jgi:hypothetical protein